MSLLKALESVADCVLAPARRDREGVAAGGALALGSSLAFGSPLVLLLGAFLADAVDWIGAVGFGLN